MLLHLRLDLIESLKLLRLQACKARYEDLRKQYSGCK